MSKTRIGEVRLASGHSLILGTLRNRESFQVHNDLSAFGLLHLGADDIMEQYASLAHNLEELEEVDLKNLPAVINPIYRGLSEVIVRKNFDPIDFSEPGVLKSSMHKMKGQSVYTNHFAYVGNEVGSVKDVLWEKSYEVNGIKIPAGFNLHMNIDALSNPKLARGILMDPPSIHSNSVTVTFAWEQSHPKMEYNDFRSKVGTIGNDGKLIRRVATDINNYFETSLVSHGADPYAKQVRGGKIVTPEMSQTRDSFSIELGKSDNFHFFSYKDEASFSLTAESLTGEENTIPADINNNDDNKKQFVMNKNLAILLAALVGFSFEENVAKLSDTDFEADPKNVEGLLSALEANADALKAFPGLQGQIDSLTEENNGLKTKVTELEAAGDSSPDKATLDAYKANLLQETLSHHTILNNGEAEPTIQKTLEGAELATLQAFHKTFKTQLESTFPLTCQDCNSHNVTRASAAAGEGEDGKDGKQRKTVGEVDHFKYLPQD